MKLNEFEKQNSEILADVIIRVVNKYNKVVIINDSDDNLSTIYAFFEKNGLKSINYIYEPNSEELCVLTHKPRKSGSSCSIQECITIKASDLSFYPCFKAAYKSILKFGRIDFETLELIPENIELATVLYFYNPVYSNLRCDRCKYCMICHKGCYIDNYILNRDFFQPILDNCNVYKKQIDEMIKNNPDLEKFIINRKDIYE